MSRTDDRASDETADRGSAGYAGEWFAESTLRVALAVLGFVLLLFALGQAVGIDLLGMVVSALNTQMGRWLLVAFFALVLIVIAVRGFRSGPAEPDRGRDRNHDRDRDYDHDRDHDRDRR